MLQSITSDQSFFVIKPCQFFKENSGKILPETSKDYSKMFGLSQDTKGFFTNNPTDWIPLMIQSQIISSELDKICVASIAFPINTPFVKRNFILKNTKKISEKFIVYNHPVYANSYRPLTSNEKKIITSRIDDTKWQWADVSFW